jgi:hypothetical protein
MTATSHTLTVHEGGLVTITEHVVDPLGADSCSLLNRGGSVPSECALLEVAVWEFGTLVHHPGIDGDALPEIDTRPAPGVYRVDLGDDGNIEPGGRIS